VRWLLPVFKRASKTVTPTVKFEPEFVYSNSEEVSPIGDPFTVQR
jgi:hypothetical protein